MERLCNKRGQGAMEFLVMFGSALFFFAIFMSIIQMNITSKNEEKQRVILQNVALDVKKEIKFAAESMDGYSREFFIPQNILGMDYEIILVENLVLATMGEQTFSYDISNVTGSIQKGGNVIKKENGKVLLNQ